MKIHGRAPGDSTLPGAESSIEIWPDFGHSLCVTHRIVFTENAIDDFKSLDARRRATVRDAIGAHLIHEPAKESKSRIKRLKELGHPQYRLRADDLRVFYDIAGEDVVILAIMSKERTEKWLEEHGEK